MEGKQQRQLCHIPGGLIKIHAEVPALRNRRKSPFCRLSAQHEDSVGLNVLGEDGCRSLKPSGVQSASHPVPVTVTGTCRGVESSRHFTQVSHCLQVSAATFPSIPTITSSIILILLSSLTDTLCLS